VRAPSLRSKSNERFIGGKLPYARFSMFTPNDSPRLNPLGAIVAEVGMLALWNHSVEKMVIM